MTDDVRTAAELEWIVGKRLLPVMMKSTNRLDDHCLHILALTSAGVLGYLDQQGRQRATVVEGNPPVAGGSLEVCVPMDAAALSPISLLWLVPGWRETLRVNGTLGADNRVRVEEAFVHCGKAIIRSDFWGPARTLSAPFEPNISSSLSAASRGFLEAAPFAVICSRDRAGAADTSPKGDPAVLIHALDSQTIAIPDRPGNQRTDTFHNILEVPEIAVLAFAPGSTHTIEIGGTARLSTAPSLLATMEVKRNVPKIALVIDVNRVERKSCHVLTHADLWNPDKHVASGVLPRVARIWADHVKWNETAGLAAKAIRMAADETLIRAGTAADYRQRLY